MRRFTGITAALMLLPFSAFAALLVLLWIFWENLGDVTLRVYDDYRPHALVPPQKNRDKQL